MTNAFTGGDKAVADMRQLKDSKMVKRSSVKGDGEVYAPDFSLSAQRFAHIAGAKQRLDQPFHVP